MGQDYTLFRFLLTDTGTSKVILGYPWLSAVQPRIDWKNGWIDHEHLPVVFRIPGNRQQTFVPSNTDRDMEIADTSKFSGLPPSFHQQLEEGDKILIARLIMDTTDNPMDKIPLPYQRFAKVFSEEASHEFPPSRIWDHAIELKPNVPTTLPSKIYPLSQAELQELEKFIMEHLKRGTI